MEKVEWVVRIIVNELPLEAHVFSDEDEAIRFWIEEVKRGDRFVCQPFKLVTHSRDEEVAGVTRKG